MPWTLVSSGISLPGNQCYSCEHLNLVLGTVRRPYAARRKGQLRYCGTLIGQADEDWLDQHVR
jgi:hypothetical protein